jgi:hypothetical protein
MENNLKHIYVHIRGNNITDMHSKKYNGYADGAAACMRAEAWKILSLSKLSL